MAAEQPYGGDTGFPARELAAASLTLARRFAAGATMWVVSPWVSHARHVAVEFVHPVIVGKRALPAIAVEGPDSLGRTLRTLVRAGDVLVAVAPGGDAVALEALRRAPAWGLTTLWIGAGARPPAGCADHVLWLGGDLAFAAGAGGFVLAYHVLWELTHVCFEHPGLLTSPDVCEGPGCVTCADEGRIGEVVEVLAGGVARVRTATGVEEIDASLIGATAPGDVLVVHAGVAIGRLEDQ